LGSGIANTGPVHKVKPGQVLAATEMGAHYGEARIIGSEPHGQQFNPPFRSLRAEGRDQFDERGGLVSANLEV
jgi:hypothetical protein